MLYVYVAFGGALGTLARVGLSGWVHSQVGYPWGTLSVNVIGSFAIGFAIRLAELSALAPETRWLITAGFCGAFTTFSAFSLEMLALGQGGGWSRAAIYAIGSVVAGLVAVVVGMGGADLLLRFMR